MDLAWLFPWLLFLHVLGRDRGVRADVRVLVHRGRRVARSRNMPISRLGCRTRSRRKLVYPIGITLPITGLAIMAVRQINPLARPYWWLALAIVLYVIAYGYSFFVQRKLVERVIEITSTPPPPGASGPPPELMALVKRIQRGGMMLGILLVAIVFLMVVKPTI